tara:strand:+ start:19022 stop:19447 length:426 start_codon:yes stop_codon:yes gene_type:complete
MRNLSLIIVGFKITSYVSSTRKANVSVVFGEEGDLKRKLFKNMTISGLLRSRLDRQTQGYEVGTQYLSVNNSTDWKENPFQLIRYGSKESPEYMLDCVDKRNSSKKVSQSPIDGSNVITYKNRWHKPEFYLRYRDNTKATV